MRDFQPSLPPPPQAFVSLKSVFRIFLLAVLFHGSRFFLSEKAVYVSWMRSSRVWMRSSRVWIRSSREWMRSSQVVKTVDSHCRNSNCHGLDSSILRHSGIAGAADETVLNKVHKNQKIPLYLVIVSRTLRTTIYKILCYKTHFICFFGDTTQICT